MLFLYFPPPAVQLHHSLQPLKAPAKKKKKVPLTIVAERTSMGRHGAVAGEALPLLETHPLMVAGLLRTGGTGSWGGGGAEPTHRRMLVGCF